MVVGNSNIPGGVRWFMFLSLNFDRERNSTDNLSVQKLFRDKWISDRWKWRRSLDGRVNEVLSCFSSDILWAGVATTMSLCGSFPAMSEERRRRCAIPIY
ncbi:hypothetical protein CEXT_354681 [Caerostris extrusa]|uniref:Uncharacterized protein n=1 Tax=Caerostris extrusa TaxID=172846 RepID=A0AAV4N4V0_CAEEX|nr:hypothetical protein CEXT_354681 [Caerostris extrusa]